MVSEIRSNSRSANADMCVDVLSTTLKYPRRLMRSTISVQILRVGDKQMFQGPLFRDSSQSGKAFGRCLGCARCQVKQRPHGFHASPHKERQTQPVKGLPISQ